MKSLNLKYFSTVFIVLILVCSIPVDKVQGQQNNYDMSFLLLNHPDGDQTYVLNITIPQSLYQYFRQQSHSMFSEKAFGKFVTPDVLKPIADSLWQVYNTTEDFTNGVLMLVHQLTYQETDPSYYPVETLVAGKGDCDLFATLSASILEAGGIKTILLYYPSLLHMEVGVNLVYQPKDVRSQLFDVQYQGLTYYIAESTGGDWRSGWRVGECPSDYQNASVDVITASRTQMSQGQVSVTLKKLDSSTITLTLSPTLIFDSTKITLNGQISPPVERESVTLQVKNSGGDWSTIGNVETSADGYFNYSWIPRETSGSIIFRASWMGNNQLNGAASSQITLIILPIYLTAIFIALIISVLIVVVAYIKRPKRSTLSVQQKLPIIQTN